MLENRTARDIMRTDIVTIAPDDTVGRLMKLLRDHSVSGAPVIDRDGALVGVVSVSDILREALREEELAAKAVTSSAREEEEVSSGYFATAERAAARPAALFPTLPRTRLASVPVHEIMTGGKFSVRPEATVPEVARFLSRAGIRRALVLENRQLVGLVSESDIVKAVAALS